MQDFKRSRRLRSSAEIRSLVKETNVHISDLIYPMFVVHGENIKKEITNLPGQYHYSIDQLKDGVQEVVDLGIKAIVLFGLPENKDEEGSEAYDSNGIVQQAIREVKKHYPNLLVITDVCLCQYTSHGHCGLVKEGIVVNDESLEKLAQTALSHAEAGADMVAPSDMMDGRVGKIREALDKNNFKHIPIMSYSVKYASAFYGPFRSAVNSAPQFGDRKTYQMDPANRIEALRQVEADIQEGADIIMVKPAFAYLDIIREVKNSFPMPVAAYHVSGEYAMIKIAAREGLLKEEESMVETLTAIKRAGADMILTYFAKDMAKWIRRNS
ncbi:porphobilinogen synthase [Clostridium formicaceticum]|uniref:Delta-aminolevulinic acid dehydratase n=1 Tax=Clostridium formicaceticum TaxID=1497 RepID=A0AAC9WF98_9CLOT|nr:porphobilinogen synthase [Clostridium formicaceticum]AOY75455.1 delta-aminolevulinic acid dehydratase [Clostridium formicaceticum]ARE85740.1 Delta-aminolevulinic acid dehydratase [Clostridium formicaceticum]